MDNTGNNVKRQNEKENINTINNENIDSIISPYKRLKVGPPLLSSTSNSMLLNLNGPLLDNPPCPTGQLSNFSGPSFGNPSCPGVFSNSDVNLQLYTGPGLTSVSGGVSGHYLSTGSNSAGSSSALQPDDVYPGGGLLHEGGGVMHGAGHKGRGNKILQNQGQLKVTAYMNFGLLTVHVIQGRQLSSKWKPMCDSFVKLSLIPDEAKKTRCKTEVVLDSNNPLFDEKFSFELNEEDRNKRLLISVWHRDPSTGGNEFLGCTSFGVRHLTNTKKEVNGWYYLLTEDIGRRKHLQVSHKQKPQLRVRSQSNIPAVNKDVWGSEPLQISVQRGKNGFGFSVVDSCPVKVGRVDGASPAELSGLQPGDIIIRVSGQNVSRSSSTSVAKLFKHCSKVTLEVQRPRQAPPLEHLENSCWRMNTPVPAPPPTPLPVDLEDQENCMPQIYTIQESRREYEISVDEDQMFRLNPDIATSTPLPLMCNGHKTVQSSETRKREAIHRLLSLELDFVDMMHDGIQRYSRPLRHCILSHSQHVALFQNIEKLTTISEYHVKQMHDNTPSMTSDDTDTSTSTSESRHFVNSIGMIYQSKVHMLCQAYDLYAKGLGEANKVLADLRQSSDFMKFIQEPSLEGRQPSISAFIYRPVQHLRELYHVLKDIFMNTEQDSGDYECLKQVVEGLQECANNITNYSCERVQSMSSIASKESKGSFTGSMKSRSSSGSSSGSSTSSKRANIPPSCSMQTIRSVDSEVMKIQDKLVFPPNIPVFQLCQDERHLIFSGEMFIWEGRQWSKLHTYLFTDIMLHTRQEADGYLKVTGEPLALKDVTGMDAQRKHGSEIVLHCAGTQGLRKVHMRAPSTEQKFAWKSLIEQRVYAIRGTLELYSSTSDISSSSSAIII